MENGVLIFNEKMNSWTKYFENKYFIVTDEYIEKIKYIQDKVLKGVGGK